MSDSKGTAGDVSLLEVDWSNLPAPKDDGDCDHLTGSVRPIDRSASDVIEWLHSN